VRCKIKNIVLFDHSINVVNSTISDTKLELHRNLHKNKEYH